MATLDPSLISSACTALDVTDVAAIGAPGGQKAVRQVKRGSEGLIMKVIALRASSPTTLTRAKREVELLESLNSDHVVRVVSDLAVLGDPPVGAAWLEEFLDGGDLSAHLGSQWSWQNTAEMAIQVAKGLAAGHARGVIHRDLSPNNVRRLGNGSYKVMDFGFARFTLQTGVTVGGQPGTYGYHTPEHLNAFSGGPIPASDVFGVGVLMFQALTGIVPIPYEGDETDYAERLSTAQIPNLAVLRPDLTPEQVALVRRALHPQPARRFRNGQSLSEALEATP
jgi:serine/threonine protein kinase